MARGFDSKSVEEQQAAYVAKRSRSATKPLSPEEAARQRERESLLLGRRQVQAQLEAARSDTHRRMLEAALADLDRKLSS